MLRRLPSRRLSRSASSSIDWISSPRVSVGSKPVAPPGDCSRAPVIVASGVRRSCETELRSRFRSRSASARSLASCASSRQERALDHERRLVRERFEQVELLRGERPRPSLGEEPDHADTSARRSAGGCRGRLAPDSVAVPSPAIWPCSMHPLRRPPAPCDRSGNEEVIPAACSRCPSASGSRTQTSPSKTSPQCAVRRCATTSWRSRPAAQTRGSSGRAPRSAPARRRCVPAWSRSRTASVLMSRATISMTPKVKTYSLSCDGEGQMRRHEEEVERRHAEERGEHATDRDPTPPPRRRPRGGRP